MIGGGNIAIGQKNSIRRVVMTGVKAFELFVSQVGNDCRIAAAIVMIGNRRKQPALQRIAQPLHRRTERAFHFIKHHAFEHQF